MVKLFFPFSNPSRPLAILQSGRGIASSRNKFCHTILALEAADVDAPIRAPCWSISAGERRKGRRREDHWSKIGHLAAMAKVSSISRFILSAVSSCRRWRGIDRRSLRIIVSITHIVVVVVAVIGASFVVVFGPFDIPFIVIVGGGGSGSPHHHRGRLSFTRGTASSVFCFGCLEFEI